jgi:Fe2+ or Zn2+ uptake regulation protein
MPDVSLATVYNTINELTELGELHVIENWHGGGIRYDTNTDHHHHLYCTQCQKLTDIYLEVDPIELFPRATQGYRIERAQLTFYGRCADCQAEGAKT